MCTSEMTRLPLTTGGKVAVFTRLWWNLRARVNPCRCDWNDFALIPVWHEDQEDLSGALYISAPMLFPFPPTSELSQRCRHRGSRSRPLSLQQYQSSLSSGRHQGRLPWLYWIEGRSEGNHEGGHERNKGNINKDTF